MDRYYIGGGNIAGILGLSPYKTPLDEYLGIIGESDAPDESTLKFFARRKALEPFAAALFEECTGEKVIRVNQRYTHPDHDFLRAELDFEPDNDVHSGEIKSVHPLAASNWGPDGTDECPIYVSAQAMWGLGITGKQLCHVVGMIGFDDFRLYQIERDEEVIAYMQDFAISFWHNHVIPRVPPEPSTLADVRKLFAKDQGGEVESQPEVADAVLRIKGISEQIKELEKESDALKVYVQAYMKDAAILRGTDGRKLATWKTQTTNRFAQKDFETDHPDLFTQYKKPSLSRVFNLA